MHVYVHVCVCASTHVCVHAHTIVSSTLTTPLSPPKWHPMQKLSCHTDYTYVHAQAVLYSLEMVDREALPLLRWLRQRIEKEASGKLVLCTCVANISSSSPSRWEAISRLRAICIPSTHPSLARRGNTRSPLCYKLRSSVLRERIIFTSFLAQYIQIYSFKPNCKFLQ